MNIAKSIIDRQFARGRRRLAWLIASGTLFALVVAATTVWGLTYSGTSAASEGPPEGSPPTATPQPRELGRDTIYVIDSNAMSLPPLDSISRVLAIDPEAGNFVAQYWTRYRPDAVLSPDGRHLYVLDSYRTGVLRGTSVDALTAIDTQTGDVAWETVLPGDLREYSIGPPVQQQVWTSSDGKLVHVFMTQSRSLRQVVVDTTTQQPIRDIDFGLVCHRTWKIPWEQREVAVCGGRVTMLDLESGEQGESLPLPGYSDASRVPSNLPREVLALGGEIAAAAGRMYLATSRQEILSVALDGSLAVDVELALPSEWQLATFDPIAVSPDGSRVYLGVRGRPSDLDHVSLAEEVWAYDTETWQKSGTVRVSGDDSAAPGDIGVFSMALSRDGGRLYTLNPNTMTLSVIDTQTMTELRVFRELGQPVHFQPVPDWIISR